MQTKATLKRKTIMKRNKTMNIIPTIKQTAAIILLSVMALGANAQSIEIKSVQKEAVKGGPERTIVQVSNMPQDEVELTQCLNAVQTEEVDVQYDNKSGALIIATKNPEVDVKDIVAKMNVELKDVKAHAKDRIPDEVKAQQKYVKR